MNNRIMGDSTTLADIPLHVDVAAVYANGDYAVTPSELEQRFPHNLYGHCWIDVNGTRPDADARDWENGDKEGSLEHWVKDHNGHAGKRDAEIYCNRSTIPEVRQLTGSQILGLDYFLWIATLDGTMYEEPGVDACQRDGEEQTGGHWDRSFLFKATLWLPKKPQIRVTPRFLQIALRAQTELVWSNQTERHANALRSVARPMVPRFPFGVGLAQRVVGTKSDSNWGPKSEEAMVRTVRDVQTALQGMMFNPKGIDGIWGPNTERAYQAARAACIG